MTLGNIWWSYDEVINNTKWIFGGQVRTLWGRLDRLFFDANLSTSKICLTKIWWRWRTFDEVLTRLLMFGERLMILNGLLGPRVWTGMLRWDLLVLIQIYRPPKKIWWDLVTSKIYLTQIWWRLTVFDEVLMRLLMFGESLMLPSGTLESRSSRERHWSDQLFLTKFFTLNEQLDDLFALKSFHLDERLGNDR